MGNPIYRASVKKENSWSKVYDMYNINYKDSKGKDRSYKTYSEAATATKLINKYFHSKNTQITPRQSIDLLQDISTTFTARHGDREIHTDWYSILRDAVADFTSKFSEGGENITAKEVYKIYERIEAAAPKG